MPAGYYFTRHARQQMCTRNISEDAVERVFWCGNRLKADDGYCYTDGQVSVIIKDFCVLTVY